MSGSAEHIGRNVLEFESEFGRDDFAARKDCDIFEHSLSSVAESGRFNRNAVEHAFEFVDDESGKRVAFNVLGDDHKFLSLLSDRLDNGENFLYR